MAYWLMKTEEEAYSIHDLARDGRTLWDGVRNYQARNYMRAMKPGHKVIVYHSNGKPSGAAGVATVKAPARPDPTAWDPRDSHYDARSTPERPLWDAVELEFSHAFPAVLALQDIQEDPQLDGLMLTSGKAMRLSVQPLDKPHFDRLVARGKRGPGKPAR